MRQRSQQLQSDLITVVSFADDTNRRYKMITQREIAHMQEIISKQGKLINEIRREFLPTGFVDVNDITGLGCLDRVQKLIHEYDEAN